jgi:ketosteroid isomerase-like protein
LDVKDVTPVTPENSRGADLPLRLLATWRKTAAGRLRCRVTPPVSVGSSRRVDWRRR